MRSKPCTWTLSGCQGPLQLPRCTLPRKGGRFASAFAAKAYTYSKPTRGPFCAPHSAAGPARLSACRSSRAQPAGASPPSCKGRSRASASAAAAAASSVAGSSTLRRRGVGTGRILQGVAIARLLGRSVGRSVGR
eukprot:scaffold2886_cov398-Prasinococcus_capsulatus_cf.AAC.18